MAAEWSFLLSLRLKRYIQPLTKMETGRMIKGSRVNSTGAGERIFSREVLPSSRPISRITTETARPERYSIRPCPKGWCRSGFCPARRKPISVTTEEPASERLLKASAVMAMEPETVPAMNLPRNSRIFRQMPQRPLSVPYWRRTAGSCTLSRSRINSRVRSSVIEIRLLYWERPFGSL